MSLLIGNMKLIRRIKALILMTGLLNAIPTYSGDLLQENRDFSAGLRFTGHTTQIDEKSGRLKFLGSESGRPITPAIAGIPKRAASAGSTSTPQRDYLRALGPRFGLDFPDGDTQEIRSSVDETGIKTTRFRQHHQGVPIIASELNVNVDSGGNLLSMSGQATSALGLDIIPKISSSEAIRSALAAVSKGYQVSESELSPSIPELSVFDPTLLQIDLGNGSQSLVWNLSITSTTRKPIRERFFIDAQKGNILLQFNESAHALNRLTYDINHGSTLPGTLVCNETNPTCSGQIGDAQKAHVYAGNTYNFYLNYHGRDSIDNAGMTLISTVRYCDPSSACPYQNAFWNGSQMVYGDSFSSDLGVVGHELTHGVTERTSNLFYYYQSGAINESFSDTWGKFVERTYSSNNDWLLGGALSIGAIRNMANPPQFGDPDRMTSTLYYTGNLDQGGVHTNSGLNNKAVSLLVDGGTFNNLSVGLVGLTKTAKIYYRAQTALLTSGSDYLALHNALYQACQDLIGTNGITSTDCNQVKSATTAVEMPLQPVTGFNPKAAYCPTGQAVSNTLFYDGIESGVGNFTLSHTSGTTNWLGTLGYASERLYSLYGEDVGSLSEQFATLTTTITATATTQIWFSHAFNFEPNYDGGTIEYSVNGGASWIDAGSLIQEGQTYTGTLPTGNPLAGRSGFMGESHGYVQTRLNLSSLQGQSVKIRWHLGTDSSVGSNSGYFGWVLDDLRIYNCSAQTAYNLTVSKTGNGSVKGLPWVDCGGNCSSSYASGTSLSLTAVPETGNQFLSWSGCTSVSNNTCNVTMSGAKSVSAAFSGAAPSSYTLSVTNGGGGSVTSSPQGISCGANCTTSFGAGTPVTLTASPSAGYQFDGWSGDCSGNGSTCSLTMSANKSVSAAFSLAPPSSYTLSVTNGGGGSVTSSPQGINCGASCTTSFGAGTPVTLTASPSAGYQFGGWSGDCSGNGLTCSLTMSANKSATATFYPFLNITKTGQGTISSSPAGISCGATCTFPFNPGTLVTLNATPTGSGTVLTSWSGDCVGGGACSVLMNMTRNVGATFAPGFSVTVNRTGNGTITSSPSAIQCGATCTAGFATGSTITLTATPDTGQTFMGWSGACSGKGTCVLTASESKTVSAQFVSTYSLIAPAINLLLQ